MENTVTLEGIKAKIKDECYLVLPDGRTTVCMLTLENGYTIKGLSACVDASNFNLDTGRKIAFEDALRQIWPLEGYLLAEKLYWDRAVPVATNPQRITLNPQQVEVIKRMGKKLHWTQTPEGKKKMAARRRRGARK